MAVPMIRQRETGTHFELIKGNNLDGYKIVQIWPEPVYEYKTNYQTVRVFLCEVDDE